MNKRRLIILLLLIVLPLLLAVPVLAYTYYAPVTVDEDGTSAHTMSPLTFAAQNSWMASNGFMTASGLDTRVETLGGSAKPHMLTETATWFTSAVPLSSQTNLYYTTGNTALTAFKIITGIGGYFFRPDAAALEPGANFSTILTDTYIDTTAGSNKRLVEKAGALGIAVDPSTSQKINASIGYTPCRAQVITGGSLDPLNGAATEYFGLMGGGAWNASQTAVNQTIPTGGTLSDLYVKYSANVPGGTTQILTVMKNGATTALTITVAAGASTGNIQGTSVSFVAGDTVSVRSTYTGAPGAFGYASWSIIWTPTIANESIMLGNVPSHNVNTLYSMLQGQNLLASTTESQSNAPMPTAGTFSKLYVNLSADPGTAPDDYKFTLRNNAAGTALTCTVVANDTAGHDSTNSVAVVASDLVDLEIVPENTPTETPEVAFGLVFTPTTLGEFVTLGGSVNNNPDTAATNYTAVHGNNESAWNAIETNVSHHLYFVRQSKLYVKLETAPDNGAGVDSYTFTLRQNAATTGITTTIADLNTTGNDTTHTFITTTGGLGAMESVPATAPAATRVHWGFVTNTTVTNVSATGIATGEHDVSAGLRPCLDNIPANSDFTSFGDSDDFSFTNGADVDLPFTFHQWIYMDDATTSTGLSKYTGAGGREYIWYTDAIDRWTVELFDESTGGYISRVSAVATEYEAGWHLFSFTYDGTEATAGMHIYIDGANADGGAPGGGVYNGMENLGASLEQGRYSSGGVGGDFMDGKFAITRVYKNREFSAAEVLAYYNSNTITAVGQVLYCQFDEGAGLPQDDSGNGHNAVSNTADWSNNGLGLAVDSQWTVPKTMVAVPDNANNWIFGSNATPYFGKVEHTVSGIEVLQYQPVTMIRGLEYSTGTVTVTNGDATVTGAGGAAWTSYMAGGIFKSTDGVFYTISSVTGATTLELASVYGGATLAVQTYNFYPRLPDTTGTYDAAIDFGTNPAGVTVALGSMTASSQPSIGTEDEDPTTDILPEASASDWFVEPDVTGTLLTHPLRPFVRLMSDTTTFTERQAWVWLGIAFVLLVLVSTAKAVRGHYLITGIAAGTAIGACVQQTIFPFWALAFVVIAILAGLVAERKPSL